MITTTQQPDLAGKKSPKGRAPNNLWTRLRNSEGLKGYLYISPWLIGFLLFGIYPIFQTFYYSFTQFNLFSDPTWVGLQNYQDILTKDPVFLKACTNMLFYVVFATMISIGGGLGLALLLSRSFPGNHFFRVLFYVPSLLVGVASAIMFKVIFGSGENGLINSILNLVHLGPINWLGDIDHPWLSVVSLILVNLWFMGGTMLIFIAGLKGISPTYYEAAQIDGGNKWQIFWTVTVPLLSPVIVFNTILTLIGHIQVFDTPLVFASAQGTVGTSSNPLGFENSLATFLTYIYRRAFIENDYGYASALSVIVFIITLILAFIVLKTIRFSQTSEQAGE